MQHGGVALHGAIAASRMRNIWRGVCIFGATTPLRENLIKENICASKSHLRANTRLFRAPSSRSDASGGEKASFAAGLLLASRSHMLWRSMAKHGAYKREA